MEAELIVWDVYEEHFDEAAFLWQVWEKALVSAEHTLSAVMNGPEGTLRAHLDALVIGGSAVVERLLLPALIEAESERLEVAAWSLLQQEEQDDSHYVFDAFRQSDGEARRRIARALSLAPRSDIAGRLEMLWDSSDDGITRALLLDAVGRRDLQWTRERLPTALAGPECNLLAAGLRALRWVPDLAYTPWVEHALSNPDVAVRREGIATGFVFGSPWAWQACQRELLGAGGATRLSLALVALAGASARHYIESCLGNPDLRKDAIWALGFAGDLAAADRLVLLAHDETVAPLAAEALTAITAVNISGPLWCPPQRPGPEVEEVHDDAPPPIVSLEEELPAPNPDALSQWWQRERSKFAVGRFVYGEPHSDAALRNALFSGTMWRREIFALELQARARSGALVALNQWTAEQMRTLVQIPR